MRVLSVGEVLWDVFGDIELLGGAALNVSVNLHRCGHTAMLVSGVGSDARGESALEVIASLGLETTLIEVVPELATGIAIVEPDGAGEPSFLISRPAAFDAFTLSTVQLDQIRSLAPQWIYMGTMVQTAPAMESFVARLRAQVPEAKCFYDVNLREGHWSLPLVERLSRRVDVLKLNLAEASRLAELRGTSVDRFSLDFFCRTWSREFEVDVMCVTLGADGCSVFAGGELHTFPGLRVRVVDTVGAGDAFAAGFLHGLDAGWPLSRCAAFANRLGALVASQSGAIPVWTLEEVREEFEAGAL